MYEFALSTRWSTYQIIIVSSMIFESLATFLYRPTKTILSFEFVSK